MTSIGFAEATSPRSNPPTPSATAKSHPRDRDSWRDLGVNDPAASSLCGRTLPVSLACPKTTSSMNLHHRARQARCCCERVGCLGRLRRTAPPVRPGGAEIQTITCMHSVCVFRAGLGLLRFVLEQHIPPLSLGRLHEEIGRA